MGKAKLIKRGELETVRSFNQEDVMSARTASRLNRENVMNWVKESRQAKAVNPRRRFAELFRTA